jgi:hypothetical protein
MSEDRKHDLACDLAHELFISSRALVLEDAEPAYLYAELEAHGYTWDGFAWVQARDAQN